ncbi:hypothetical protein [Conexibacter sp. DBS9H8]|uniref:hypothetical protein n=1 Tax=Conexibacter sp. DBS9H8 TaxID=2937801 RepID=UPI00200C04AB|nr:hypothetical protein [Conexibacter sp. DBS9H8]
MEVIATATAGLMLWIVIWALGVSGLDALIIGIVAFLIALSAQTLAPRLAPFKSR